MLARPSPRFRKDDGFSLLEALVATSIMAVGIAALAQLAGLSLYANGQARQTTVAPVLAQQKIEELVAEAAVGGLAPSPAGTLASDVAGYCDFVDRAGRPLGAGPAPPADSAYARRWSIEPLPASPAHTSILQVLVIDLRHHAAASAVPADVRLPGDARVVAAAAGRAF
jgi:prepilin-type N-terminal cleavage/methylation domain-containing protein